MKDVIDFEIIDESGPQSYSGACEIPSAELERVELAGNVEVKIDATVDKGHVEGEYIAIGTSSLTAVLECSRCVEPYPFAITSPFHVRFRPRPEVSAENEEIEITDQGELDVEFYTERSVPLRDLAVEQVQLSIPMKPLCDDRCLGLCPHCGANRAREKCSCGESVVDQRWDALQGIRDELSKKKDV